METPQLLPDNILQKQVCQECFQYLSVPPIVINSRGETICGRCVDKSGKSQSTEYTKSYFNVIAEKFLFKCTNHFNGCTKVVSLAEAKGHEETCTYAKQECFFCSFSGNLSQIVNHCLKYHPENISLDGKFPFILNCKAFQKNLLLILNDKIFKVVFNITDDLFTAVISSITKTILPTSNQYGVRFFKSIDPTNINYILTDYGLLSENIENYFQKNIGELVTFFGPASELCCEILIQQFTLTVQEFEIKQRLAKIRQSEEDLNNFNRKLQDTAQNLSEKSRTYDAAMSVIKRMSYDLFKCCSCQKITLQETYFCPKNHCHCKACLGNICKICKSVQEFNRLEDIEKFVISCDWPGCEKNLCFKDYLKHKNECLLRPYKCPLLNCHEVLYSSQKLVEHWHCVIPPLIEDNTIVCKGDVYREYYWLIANDLYHVLINFDDTVIQVLINEVNVLPNNISFQCVGFLNNDSVGKCFTSTTFCGKFQVYMPNAAPPSVQPKPVNNIFGSSSAFGTIPDTELRTSTTKAVRKYYLNLKISIKYQ